MTDITSAFTSDPQNDAEDYLRSVENAHRKEFGQFFTPQEVADFMVHWVLRSGEKGVHDPAFGLGSFLHALSGEARLNFSGSEVDPEMLKFWKARIPDSLAASVRQEDYLLSWGREFGNIVCNPPYLRFQNFANRKTVFEKLRRAGVNVSGYTNSASAFLLKSLIELRQGGRLAYIMPLEFLNTGYGIAVKRQLLEGSHIAALIKLDCERDVFPDATTSVGIILYDSARHFGSVRFFNVQSLEMLSAVLDSDPTAEVGYGELDPEDNWLPHFDNCTFIDSTDFVPLTQYGHFIRGIATGANKFFVLKQSGVKENRLSTADVTPVIAKSAQITSPIFTDIDIGDLIKNDARVLLFRPDTPLSNSAHSYIQYGERKGFNQGYITRHRHPWHKLERRQPAPLLFSVFSRGGYKVVRNKTSVLNLTCFHGFQPNIWGEKYLDHLFLYLLSPVGRRVASLFKRQYGDGLDKFEPGDLNRLLSPAPHILESLPQERVQAIMACVNEADEVACLTERLFEDMAL